MKTQTRLDGTTLRIGSGGDDASDVTVIDPEAQLAALNAEIKALGRNFTPRSKRRFDVYVERGFDKEDERIARFNAHVAATSQPPAAATPTSGIIPLKTARRGRLPKEDSEASRAAMLAELRNHPTLQDDPDALGRLIGVSGRQVRRWLKEENKKYTDSVAAKAQRRK